MHKNTAVNEFINKVIGTKWVDRACTFNEMDCWGGWWFFIIDMF